MSDLPSREIWLQAGDRAIGKASRTLDEAWSVFRRYENQLYDEIELTDWLLAHLSGDAHRALDVEVNGVTYGCERTREAVRALMEVEKSQNAK